MLDAERLTLHYWLVCERMLDILNHIFEGLRMLKTSQKCVHVQSSAVIGSRHLQRVS